MIWDDGSIFECCFDSEETVCDAEYLHDLNYKPVPVFYREKKEAADSLYCGIELEIQGANRKGVVDENSDDGFFYYKSDTSLSSTEGIEIVSHPATLRYHLTHWKRMFDSFRRNGMNRLDCCGLHFHFGRDHFTHEEIALLDYFINSNSDFTERLGGRTIMKSFFNLTRKRMKDWGEDVYSDRNLALNLSNETTIEMRFFASTDRYDVFVERVKTAFALVSFCRGKSIAGCDIAALTENFEKYLLGFKKEF